MDKWYVYFIDKTMCLRKVDLVTQDIEIPNPDDPDNPLIEKTVVNIWNDPVLVVGVFNHVPANGFMYIIRSGNLSVYNTLLCTSATFLGHGQFVFPFELPPNPGDWLPAGVPANCVI